jgi:hypothetical protein
MALSLEQLQALRDELQKWMYSGALEVRFNDRWYKFQNYADQERALARLDSQIEAASSASGTSTPRTTLATFTKG